MVSIILVIFFGVEPRHIGGEVAGEEGGRRLPEESLTPGKDVAGQVEALAGVKQPVAQGGHHGGVVGAEGGGDT